MGGIRSVNDSLSMFPDCVDFADEKHVFNRLGLAEQLQDMSLDETHHFLTEWVAEKKRKFMLNPKKLCLFDIDAGGEFHLFFASMGKFEHFVRSYMRFEKAEYKLDYEDLTREQREWALADRDRQLLELDKYFNQIEGTVVTGLYKRFCDALALIGDVRAELLELEKESSELAAQVESEELFDSDDQGSDSGRMFRRTDSTGQVLAEDAVVLPDWQQVEPTAAGKNTRKQVRSVRFVRSVRVFKHLIIRATGPPYSAAA